MRRVAVLVLWACTSGAVVAHAQPAAPDVAVGSGRNPHSRPPVLFEENVGQLPTGIVFSARGERSVVAFTSDGRVTIGGESIALMGGRRVQPRGIDRAPAHINYFRGKDPQRWFTDVPVYASVILAEVYPGIDWVWKSGGGAMEYDFVVRPGAGPKTIRLGFPRGTALRLASGDLIVMRDGTEMAHRRPRAYQDVDGQRRGVVAAWRIAGSVAWIAVGEYDARYPLVIDPVLAWSQYLDGQVDFIDATVDAVALPDRSVVVTGGPILSGGSINDLVVSRFTAGGALLYTTLLGGSGADTAPHIAADASGRIFLAGATTSADFPVRNAAQAASGGGQDAYVMALGPVGDLVFATYAGGGASDIFNAIAVAPDGSVWATGGTFSDNFPSPGGFRTTLAPDPFVPGGSTAPNAVVEHLSRNGQLIMASYLATYLDEGVSTGSAIAIGADNSVYLTATTQSRPSGRSRPFAHVLPDAMPLEGVGRISPHDGSPVWFKAFGQGDLKAIAVSPDQLVWVAGSAVTNGSTDPRVLTTPTPDAYDSTCGTDGLCDGNGDGFLMALDSAGTKVYATFLGGSAIDFVTAMRVSPAGSLWLTGRTDSSDWPDAKSPVVPRDILAMRFSPATRTVTYVARVGGDDDDSSVGIAPDAQDGAYLAGSTRSTDLPARRNARTSSVDRFLAYFASPVDILVVDRPVNNAAVAGNFVEVAGWAIDERSASGSGVDAVHMWAFPTAPAGAPVFLGAATIGISRPDVAAAFGARFDPSGYTLATSLPSGQYTIGVYAHILATQMFEAVRTVSVTVVDTTRHAIDVPISGATVPRAFSVAGWVLDTASATGPGIDYLEVYVFTSDSPDGVYGGRYDIGIERPDVAAAFGERFRFSGFLVPVAGTPGLFTVAIFPHLAGQTRFGAPAVVTVQVSGGSPR